MKSSLTCFTYASNGQLLCILCDSVVRSEAVWSVHINSKKHRENIVNVKSIVLNSHLLHTTLNPSHFYSLKLCHVLVYLILVLSITGEHVHNMKYSYSVFNFLRAADYCILLYFV